MTLLGRLKDGEMDLTQKEYDALQKILEFENTAEPSSWKLGWEWSGVGVHPAIVNNLITKGFVVKTYSSNRYKHYKLTEEGKNAAQSGPIEVPQSEDFSVDFSNLFSTIVGHDDIKELIREALQLDKPLHVLLWGPPAIAKTLFLWEIERLGGGRTLWLMGSGASKAGMWDMIADRKPRWLLVDELEKMPQIDQAGLLSLMEKGRITRTKVNRNIDVVLKTWVIATANRIDHIHQELKSRFAIQHLEEYSAREFMAVVVGVLQQYENIDEESSHNIALKLVGKTHDVRDAIRVARLSVRVGVDRAVELLIR